jgi:TatA/E family protein of Tat protein translocase
MNIGFGQILLILTIGLLLFGGRHLPQLFKNLAEGIHTFRETLSQGDSPKGSKNSTNSIKDPVIKKYKKGN